MTDPSHHQRLFDEALASLVGRPCWGVTAGPGPMLTTLGTLVDHTITAAVATPPCLDLELHFSNGQVLRVFCDQTSQAEPGDNYGIHTAG